MELKKDQLLLELKLLFLNGFVLGLRKLLFHFGIKIPVFLCLGFRHMGFKSSGAVHTSAVSASLVGTRGSITRACDTHTM
jgi:hypothetical protein